MRYEPSWPVIPVMKAFFMVTRRNIQLLHIVRDLAQYTLCSVLSVLWITTFKIEQLFILVHKIVIARISGSPGRVVDILEACGAFDPGSSPGRGAIILILNLSKPGLVILLIE